MKPHVNVFEIKPISQNQLMTIIFNLENLMIDTQNLVIDDWELMTVSLQLTYKKSKFMGASVYAVYKDEKSFKNLHSDNYEFEKVEDMSRFFSILKIIKNGQEQNY